MIAIVRCRHLSHSTSYGMRAPLKSVIGAKSARVGLYRRHGQKLCVA